MTRVLVTGATGVLGRALHPRLTSAGFEVRGMSRRDPIRDPSVQWVQADLRSGEGLDPAVKGVDVIVQAASSPYKHTEAVDVRGTSRLLRAAEKAGVSHLVYISIVGIERIPFGYYQHKLAAEEVVKAGAIPWSILRATQFHSLMAERFLPPLFKLPFVPVPADFKFQLIDSGEVAGRLVQAVKDGPEGRLADIGGPKVQRLEEIARAWKRARGLSRWVIPVRMPGKLAQERREVYPGQWLPEPLETKEDSRVIDDVMLAESLSTAFLVLLESLTPAERAVFLLREAFDFEYAHIAEIVGKSESNCRKMASRARQYISERKPRFDASPEQRKRLTAKFVSAVQGGDLEGLIDVLAKEAVLYSDGGGKVPSARQPIYGAERIARFLIGLMRKAPADSRVRLTGVNGMPGIVVYAQGKPLTVYSLEIGAGKIRNVYGVVNPDKLQRFS